MNPISTITPHVQSVAAPVRAKLRYVDALRGWAIIAVVLMHTLWYSGSEIYHYPWVVALADAGARGVQLFYIVSAFTLFLSMNNRQKLEKSPMLNFFIRRFFRIAPLFYLAIIYYALWQYFANGVRFTLPNIVTTYFFVNGVSPHYINNIVPGGWSITVEVAFYLIAPWLFRYVKSLDSAVWFVLLSVAGSSVLSYWLRSHPMIDVRGTTGQASWEWFLFLYFPNQAAIFGYGLVLFHIVKTGELALKPRTLLACGLAICIVLIVVTAAFPDQTYHHNLIMFFPHIPIHLLFGVGFVFIALALRWREYTLLVNRFTIFVGKISFSLYLVNSAVFMAGARAGLFDSIPAVSGLDTLLVFAGRFIFTLVISSAISFVLYRLIEIPGQQLGKNIITRLEK